MDTDWCIVCDSRIYPSTAEASKVPQTSEELAEFGASCGIQSSSSAFCSTTCLVQAYHEAKSFNHSGLSPRTFSIQYPIPLHSSRHTSSPAPPNHRSCKDQPKLESSDYSIQRLTNQPHERKKISQFTFGSYVTSSMSSSDSLQ